MQPSRFATSLAKLLFLAGPALLAQSGTLPPPPVMMFVREEIKPGRGAAHTATEAAWVKALVQGKSTDHYLAMTSMTGSSEALYLGSYGSYGEWAAKQKEMDKNPSLMKEIEKIAQEDGEHLTGSRSFMGTYRKDLSFGPDVAIAKMRYFRVRTFKIRQGQVQAFEEGLKVALDAYAKIHYPASFACYEVTAGLQSGTFVLLRPMKSMEEMDVLEAMDKTFREALGEDGRKTLQKTFAEAVLGVENQLYSFNPKLSFVPAAYVAADPDFWGPKPAGK